MDLRVIDSVNREAGFYLLRSTSPGVASQIAGDSSATLISWSSPVDPVRYEVHSDGRCIRVGNKRFVIDDTHLDAEIDNWLRAYKAEDPRPLPSSAERLDSLIQEGLLTAEEMEQIEAERIKKERLENLRKSGLLSDEELGLIGASQPVKEDNASTADLTSRQQSVARPQQFQPVYSRPMSTNAFAIASFVLSLVGGSLLAVIFGHIALSQINRTREGGRGLAVAGLIIGYISMAIIAIFIIGLMSAASDLNNYDY